jgi:acyl carrier protein
MFIEYFELNIFLNKLNIISKQRKGMNDFIVQLKKKIIKTLDLEDVTPDDFSEEDRLIGGSLGLDSIDALELVMMIESDYGVKIDNKELGEKVFSSIKALAEYIQKNKPELVN